MVTTDIFLLENYLLSRAFTWMIIAHICALIIFFFHSYSHMIPSRNKTHFQTISFDHVSFCISSSLDVTVFKLCTTSYLKPMCWWFHFNDIEHGDVLLAHLTVFRHTIRCFKRLMSTLLKKSHSYNDTGFHCSSCNETISVVNCKKQSWEINTLLLMFVVWIYLPMKGQVYTHFRKYFLKMIQFLWQGGVV